MKQTIEIKRVCFPNTRLAMAYMVRLGSQDIACIFQASIDSKWHVTKQSDNGVVTTINTFKTLKEAKAWSLEYFEAKHTLNLVG